MKWRKTVKGLSLWAVRVSCILCAVWLLADARNTILWQGKCTTYRASEAVVSRAEQRLVGQAGGFRTPLRPRFKTLLEVSFTVNGKEYKGTPLFFHAFRPWTQGQQIEIHYNPENPSEFVLSKSAVPEAWTDIWLLLGLLIIYGLIEWKTHTGNSGQVRTRRGGRE